MNNRRREFFKMCINKQFREVFLDGVDAVGFTSMGLPLKISKRQIQTWMHEELLKNNKGMRISDVAHESGYNDSRYFSTTFKKFFGKSPKDY